MFNLSISYLLTLDLPSCSRSNRKMEKSELWEHLTADDGSDEAKVFRGGALWRPVRADGD